MSKDFQSCLECLLSYLQATVPLATETLTVMRKNRLGFQLLGPHDMTCKVGRLDEEG